MGRNNGVLSAPSNHEIDGVAGCGFVSRPSNSMRISMVFSSSAGPGRGQRFDSPIVQRPVLAAHAHGAIQDVLGTRRARRATSPATPARLRLRRSPSPATNGSCDNAAGRFDGRIGHPLQPPGVFPAEARSRAGARKKSQVFQCVAQFYRSSARDGRALPRSSVIGGEPPDR
jgi:hypothetical protein